MQHGKRFPAQQLIKRGGACKQQKKCQWRHEPRQQAGQSTHACHQLDLSAARLLGKVQSGNGAHGKKRNYPARHQQGDGRHDQQAGIQGLHQFGVIAVCRLRQIPGIGRAQRQHHDGHAVVAGIAAGNNDSAQGDRSPGKKQQFAGGCHAESVRARHQEADAGDQPQAQQCRQRRSAKRIFAGPVGACRQQKTHGNRRDKAPQHLVRVPGKALQGSSERLWRKYPQSDGYSRPQRAGRINQPETQLKAGF